MRPARSDGQPEGTGPTVAVVEPIHNRARRSDATILSLRQRQEIQEVLRRQRVERFGIGDLTKFSPRHFRLKHKWRAPKARERTPACLGSSTWLTSPCWPPFRRPSAVADGGPRQISHGWSEKFLGRVPSAGTSAACLWFHAVSVGEVLQLEPVLPSCAAGSPRRIRHFDHDADRPVGRKGEVPRRPRLLFSARLFLGRPRSHARLRPTAIVLVELELWPNFVLHAHRAEFRWPSSTAASASAAVAATAVSPFDVPLAALL